MTVVAFLLTAVAASNGSCTEVHYRADGSRTERQIPRSSLPRGASASASSSSTSTGESQSASVSAQSSSSGDERVSRSETKTGDGRRRSVEVRQKGSHCVVTIDERKQ